LRFYFGINYRGLSDAPWSPGTVYIYDSENLPAEFQTVRYSTNAKRPIRHLAKVSVAPSDWPFLDRVNGFDPIEQSQRQAMTFEGYPWPDDVQIHPSRSKRVLVEPIRNYLDANFPERTCLKTLGRKIAQVSSRCCGCSERPSDNRHTNTRFCGESRVCGSARGVPLRLRRYVLLAAFVHLPLPAERKLQFQRHDFLQNCEQTPDPTTRLAFRKEREEMRRHLFSMLERFLDSRGFPTDEVSTGKLENPPGCTSFDFVASVGARGSSLFSAENEAIEKKSATFATC
jgi:hypothetical protein